jgi:hypothetical protein
VGVRNEQDRTLVEAVAMRSALESKEALTDDVLDELVKAIRRLTYGTITLKVHNAKIMQMEITEKRRFDEQPRFEKGDGI